MINNDLRQQIHTTYKHEINLKSYPSIILMVQHVHHDFTSQITFQTVNHQMQHDTRTSTFGQISNGPIHNENESISKYNLPSKTFFEIQNNGVRIQRKLLMKKCYFPFLGTSGASLNINIMHSQNKSLL